MKGRTMIDEALDKYVGLADDYALKGSTKQQFLFSLRRPNEKFILEEDQFVFLKTCDGCRTIRNILADYDVDSQQTVIGFLSSLIEVGAVILTERPYPCRVDIELVPEPRLQAVHFEATSRCNMGCVHCYYGNRLNARNDLSLEEISRMADEMEKMQVEIVAIGGGEPFMRNDIFDVVSMVEARGMRISALFTNGVLLTPDIAGRILGCRSRFTVFVSLDTITPEGMEFRGFSVEKGAEVLSKIIQNIRFLTRSGVPVVVNTVVTKYNIGSLLEIHKVVGSLGIKSWRIGFPKRTGSFIKNADRSEEKWENIAKVCLNVLRCHLEQGRPFHLQVEYLYREELFKDLQPLSDQSFVCDYELRREGCCIKPNGDVVSCAYCGDMPVGNVRERSLWDIWYSQQMQDIKNIRICDVRDCQGCLLRSICATGCRINAYFLHGDFYNAKDDYACEATKFFYEKVVPLLGEHNILPSSFELHS